LCRNRVGVERGGASIARCGVWRLALSLLVACAPRPDGYPVAQLPIGPAVASCRAQSCCYPWSERAWSVSPCVRVEETSINGATGALCYVRVKVP
jgi:hypothetical protein